MCVFCGFGGDVDYVVDGVGFLECVVGIVDDFDVVKIFKESVLCILKNVGI